MIWVEVRPFVAYLDERIAEMRAEADTVQRWRDGLAAGLPDEREPAPPR